MDQETTPNRSPAASELISPGVILTQVLAAVNDLREEFTLFRRDSQEMRTKMSEMATKDDLKQFITRDLADSRENAAAERMNAMTTRQQRTEDRLDELRQQWHSRELSEKDHELQNRDRAYDQNTYHAARNEDATVTGLFRGNDRLWAIFVLVVGLIGSPIAYILLNSLFNHR